MLMDSFKKHWAWYWAPGTSDGSGGFTYSAPTLIQCWWYQGFRRAITAEGDEFVSSEQFFASDKMELGGWLLGTADPSETTPDNDPRLARAHAVKSLTHASGFCGTDHVYAAYV